MSSTFGRWLVELGALPDEAALADVLARQSERLPTASVAYVLGYAPERTLAGVLAAATGRPAIVLDESVIDVGLLGDEPAESWLRGQALPVCVDDGTLYVAAARPEDVDRARIDAIAGGRPVVIAAALAVTVARTLRGALAARARGEVAWAGPEAGLDDATLEDEGRRPRAALVGYEARAVLESVTREIDVEALMGAAPPAELLDDELDLPSDAGFLAPRAGWPTGRAWSVTGVGSVPGASVPGASSLQPAVEAAAEIVLGDADLEPDADVAELVARMAEGPAVDPTGLASVLIVDDDYATRHLLVKELEPRGYQVATAASGEDAVTALGTLAPALVIADILLPGVDGFRLCRAIRKTARLRDAGIVLMSAVIESGRVTPEVLARYHADGYAAKPLDTARLMRIVRELLGRKRAAALQAADDDGLRRALDRYQAGDLDGAIAVLRARAEVAPAAGRVRFALANMLQRARRISEAIAEYEAVLEHTHDYFPALTRLAYLYYRRGETARAIETWRRSLPYCEDRGLRRNIELFVRSLG